MADPSRLFCGNLGLAFLLRTVSQTLSPLFVFLLKHMLFQWHHF
jgi:hypothetical protein